MTAVRGESAADIEDSLKCFGFAMPDTLHYVPSISAWTPWPVAGDSNTLITDMALTKQTVNLDMLQNDWLDCKDKDLVASSIALKHIAEHELHSVCRNFFHSEPMKTSMRPQEQRGLSRQFFVDFKERFKIPEDMPVLVVQHMARYFTAGTGRSFAELMEGQRDAEGRLYLSSVTLFVSHFTGYVMSEDIDAIGLFERQEGRQYYSFMDSFAINQNNVGDELGPSDNPSFDQVIKCAETTLLVLTPWHDPGVIRRVWCLAETMWTLKNGCALRVALCSKEQKSLLAALRGQHPDGLTAASVLESVFVVDFANAEASKASDQAMVFRWVQEQVAGGIDELNHHVKDGLRAALVNAVLAAAAESQGDEDLMFGVGRFFDDMGRLEQALEYYERGLKVYEKDHGADHISSSSADTLNKIADVYRRTNRIHSMGQHEWAIGSTYYNSTILQHTTASGGGEQALTYYKRALKMYEKAHGVDHISSLATIRSMAGVYHHAYSNGDYERALEYYKRALKINEKDHGVDHISSAETLEDIASVYRHQEDEHKQALEYYERALKIKEKALGMDHISCANTLNDICDLCHDDVYYERGLAIYAKADMADCISSAAEHEAIASEFERNYECEYKALKHYKLALQIYEKAHGVDHISSLATVSSMAEIYHMKGEHKQSLEYYDRALKIKEKARRMHHTGHETTDDECSDEEDDTGWAQIDDDNVLANQSAGWAGRVYGRASMYARKGDYEKALEYYERALKVYQARFGDDHLNTTVTTREAVAALKAHIQKRASAGVGSGEGGRG
jgi:tetratricopeptide (TPR) repeat protein